jgi:hypothetical protein
MIKTQVLKGKGLWALVCDGQSSIEDQASCWYLRTIENHDKEVIAIPMIPMVHTVFPR